MPDTLEELRALEREVELEWWWLHGALNAVAQAQAERSHGDFSRFREMQAQAWRLIAGAWTLRIASPRCRRQLMRWRSRSGNPG